jgi:hypothetical protein
MPCISCASFTVRRTGHDEWRGWPHTRVLACGGFDFAYLLLAVPPLKPLTPPPQPSNPQSSPFPAKHLAGRHPHAILSRVHRIPSRPSLTRALPPFLSAVPHLLTCKPYNLQTIIVQAPSNFSHPGDLLSCQHNAPVSPLAATPMNLPASVANKRLTENLTPLDSTLTKNRGEGVSPTFKPSNLQTFQPSNLPTFKRFSPPFNFQLSTVNLPSPISPPYLVTSLRPHFGAHLPKRSIAQPKGDAILDLAFSRCPKE